MPSPKWTFVSRFRRNAFGWRSSLPIQRLKEAVSEIRSVARADPALAAEGAVVLLERLSPALEQVDSSSGALGSAVSRAIEALVPIVAAADVEPAVRERWLERLFEALQDDQMPYIESLGEHWGSLCVTPELASQWADRLLPLVTHVLQAEGFNYFVGVVPCLSALYAAGRFEEIIELVHWDRLSYWWYRRWAVDALVCLGRPGDALRLAEASRGLNAPESAIARACETILLSSGMTEEAYARYAIAANRAGTYLATFRAISKKYPGKGREAILSDLVQSEPGSEGKWFAAAKDAGLLDQAVALSRQSPTDPKTLIRAARGKVRKRVFPSTVGRVRLSASGPLAVRAHPHSRSRTGPLAGSFGVRRSGPHLSTVRSFRGRYRLGWRDRQYAGWHSRRLRMQRTPRALPVHRIQRTRLQQRARSRADAGRAHRERADDARAGAFVAQPLSDRPGARAEHHLLASLSGRFSTPLHCCAREPHMYCQCRFQTNCVTTEPPEHTSIHREMAENVSVKNDRPAVPACRDTLEEKGTGSKNSNAQAKFNSTWILLKTPHSSP